MVRNVSLKIERTLKQRNSLLTLFLLYFSLIKVLDGSLDENERLKPNI